MTTETIKPHLRITDGPWMLDQWGHVSGWEDTEHPDPKVSAKTSVTLLDNRHSKATTGDKLVMRAAPELLEFIERWRDVIVGGDNPETLEGWAQEFNEQARKLIASARGHS